MQLRAHAVLSCHVSLVSFNLEQLLSLFSILMTLTLLRLTGQLFVVYPSPWVCLLFPCG